MNTQPQISRINIFNEDFNNLYKIYTGIEKDRNGNVVAIDIIDGYLKNDEKMFLKSSYLLDDNIWFAEIEVVSNSQMNTYLKISSEFPKMNSIFVKVCKKGKTVGYQWIDFEGNILSVPSLAPAKINAAELISK